MVVAGWTPRNVCGCDTPCPGCDNPAITIMSRGDGDFCGFVDLVIDPATDDFMTAAPLHGRAIIALSCESAASDTDAVSGMCGYRGGWWADTWRAAPLGSRLWTLRNKQPVTNTRNLVSSMMQTALAFLVKDGAAKAIRPNVIQDARTRKITINTLDIVRPDSSKMSIETAQIWGAYFG